MSSAELSVAVIGAGLAGCECAMALAQRGIKVTLFEMKPHSFSPAHESEKLAELVCSNSFRSDDPENAVGVLKEEMRMLSSLTLDMAEKSRVPAGKALAVDRDLFSSLITERIKAEPGITLVRKEIIELSPELEPVLAGFSAIVVTAGPVASEGISNSLGRLTGAEHLYFYDAIAPIVAGDSLDMNIVFQGSRYDEGEGDYLNCPLNQEEYTTFYQALLEGKKITAKNFEQEQHFEGCMPIETLAERGEKTLLFGAFKPVGFTDPRTGRRPYAIVQLRAENLNRSMFNLVGCQTKLLYNEQDRIFRLIPGLEKAEFVRYGSMHRNTFINSPKVLDKNLALLTSPQLYLAGQITGVEGYVESAASGLWLGLSLAALLHGNSLLQPPVESALGALLNHLRTEVKHFQPSNVQYGLMPELQEKAGKKQRKAMYAERARTAFRHWLAEVKL